MGLEKIVRKAKNVVFASLLAFCGCEVAFLPLLIREELRGKYKAPPPSVSDYKFETPRAVDCAASLWKEKKDDFNSYLHFLGVLDSDDNKLITEDEVFAAYERYLSKQR